MSLCNHFRAFPFIAILILIGDQKLHGFTIERFDNLEDLNVAESKHFEEASNLKSINVRDVDIVPNGATPLVLYPVTKTIPVPWRNQDSRDYHSLKKSPVVLALSSNNENYYSINKHSKNNDPALDVTESFDNIPSESENQETFVPFNNSTANVTEEITSTNLASYEITTIFLTPPQAEITTKQYEQSNDQTTITIGQNLLENLTTSSLDKDLMSEPVATELTTFSIENFEEPKRKNYIITTSVDELINTKPQWKKYTEIDRKRVTIVPENKMNLNNDNNDDMVKANSIKTRVSLENVLNMASDIPSIEQLKQGLLDNDSDSKIEKDRKEIETESILSTDSSTMLFDIKSLPGQQATNPIDITTAKIDTSTPKYKQKHSNILTTILQESNSYIPTVTDYVSTISNFKQMSSQRAGYLNNSNNVDDIIITTEGSIPTTLNEAKIDTGFDETIMDFPQNQTFSNMKSQGILDEDEKREELLKEEIINNIESAKKIRDDSVKPLQPVKTVHKVSTENILKVQPIKHDKIKNENIYTVNPNYKGLKRLEIHPPKPYFKHPDDNSWRNESISSLGIVFKPKNSTKAFTQVLKNKTETEFNNLTEKNVKEDVPELRERLGKISEQRKSKKKKVKTNGETIYADYDSAESTKNPNSDKNIFEINRRPTIPPTRKHEYEEYYHNKFLIQPVSTESPKRVQNVVDYKDIIDSDGIDYPNFLKLDLKKYTENYVIRTPTGATANFLPSTDSPPQSQTNTPTIYFPERKGTIQYFPPTTRSTPATTPKVNINDYDIDFQRKINLFDFEDPAKTTLATTTPVTEKNLLLYYDPKLTEKTFELQTDLYKINNQNKNAYQTYQTSALDNAPYSVVRNDEGYNRANYVIKHYGDFLKDAAGVQDEGLDYVLRYKEEPLKGVTLSNELKSSANKGGNNNYENDAKLRNQSVLDKLVDNLNQNSDQYKADFPVLYNNSVVHKKMEENGKVIASSLAYMKRLNENGEQENTGEYLVKKKAFDPSCENQTVELSPEYELHYYVPDQEEKEMAQLAPVATFGYF